MLVSLMHLENQYRTTKLRVGAGDNFVVYNMNEYNKPPIFVLIILI